MNRIIVIVKQQSQAIAIVPIIAQPYHVSIVITSFCVCLCICLSVITWQKLPC